MASAAIGPQFDTTQAQTINYGGGQTLSYDPSSGLYMDSGGNILQPADVAQYGQPVSVTQGLFAPVASTPTAPGGSSTQAGATTGLSSIFGSIFSAIGGTGSALNPPKTINGVPYVYSSAAGSYVPATATGAALGNITMSPTVIIVGLGAILLIAFFVLKK